MRNSVGEDSYVADEVIISRNKLRVRIGNTDAEGRMILGDVLCKVRYAFYSRYVRHRNWYQQILASTSSCRFFPERVVKSVANQIIIFM